MNRRVDAVFVLSVKTFHDRVRHIEAELGRHGIAFEWIFEHDADELKQEEIEAVFAPSDMKRGHQSLVLKHIETWKRCVERNYRRVLVFEDDAVLAKDFNSGFETAMDEADAIQGPYMIYLGCGDNKYVERAPRSPRTLVVPGMELPATDAIVLDRRAAELRLAYIAQRKITRPADWLMREADAAMGITQYWLRKPIVEQGSMNGRFLSVLDERRTDRGRRLNWLRYRWDRLRRRTLGSTRPPEARSDSGEDRRSVRLDVWAISLARFAASLTAIGAFVAPGIASASAGIMVVALLAAPSRGRRLKAALQQPLGRATLVLVVVLAASIAWTPVGWKTALHELFDWRNLLWLLAGLALFDTARAKASFATLFMVAAALTAVVAIVSWWSGIALHTDVSTPHVVFRNHVTQAMAFAAGTLFALLLAMRADLARWRRAVAATAAVVLVAGLVVATPGRSGFVVLVIVALVVSLTQFSGRARVGITVAVVSALVGLSAVSPLVIQRFQLGLHELRDSKQATDLTSMGIRVVMWENTVELVREAPWLGHGLGAFAQEYKRVAAARGVGWRATPAKDPHNQYLFLLAEAGVLGLAAFVWWLAAAVRQPATGPFRTAGLALLLSWCITSLFSSHFKAFNEGHMIMVFLGVLLARHDGLHAPSAARTAATTSS